MWFQRFLKRPESQKTKNQKEIILRALLSMRKNICKPVYIRDVSSENENIKAKKNLKEYITDFRRLAAFTSSLEQDQCIHFRAGLNKALTQDLRWVPSHSLDMLIKDSFRFQTLYEIETTNTDHNNKYT
jgi:hypothetical protein